MLTELPVLTEGGVLNNRMCESMLSGNAFGCCNVGSMMIGSQRKWSWFVACVHGTCETWADSN